MYEPRSEGTEMSSVAEFQMLVREVAEHTADSRNWKDKVRAVARALGMEWSRAKAAYYGEVRRVDAAEMDNARKTIREIRARQEARRQARQFSATIAYLRQADEAFHRHTIDALERAVLSAGDVAGTGIEE